MLIDKQIKIAMNIKYHYMRIIHSLKYFYIQVSKHYPTYKEKVNRLFQKSLILLLNLRCLKLEELMKMRLVHQINWYIFLDSIIVDNDDIQNHLHKQLLYYVLYSLITERAKLLKKFWTNEYQLLSKSLPLLQNSNENNPHVIRNRDTLCINEFLLAENKYLLDKMKPINTKEITKLKTIQIVIYPTKEQIKVFNKVVGACDHVFNKTIDFINKEVKKNPNYQQNLYDIRNLVVTNNTKTTDPEYIKQSNIIKALQKKKFEILIPKKKKNNQKEIDDANAKRSEYDIQIEKEQIKLKEVRKNIKSIKNPLVEKWETESPKASRNIAVGRAVAAYNSGKTNFENGNIKFFNIRKKENSRTLDIDSSMIWIEKGQIRLSDSCFFETPIKISSCNTDKYSNLVINHACTITNKGKSWILGVPVSIPKVTDTGSSFCGIDLGLKTFGTIYGVNSDNKGCITEITYNRNKLNKLNKKYDEIKKAFNGKGIKRKICEKIERDKANLIKEIHWKTISYIMKHYSYIFLGDIKSHSIVSGNKNKALNREVCDLSLFQFKQRCMYKALSLGKYCRLINEAYSTKTCNECGYINTKVGSSDTYRCKACGNFGRDQNGAKNIGMKGIITCKL